MLSSRKQGIAKMLGEYGVLSHEEVLEQGGYHFGVRVLEQRHPVTGRVDTVGVRVGLKHRGPDGDARDAHEPCVSIAVTTEHEDERFRTALPADTARISHVSYAPCCALAPGPPLARGGGSAVMVRAACNFVLRRYPHVKKFKLKDTSAVPYVVAGQRRMLQLQELSLCHSGKTWYERTFGAELADESIHGVYRKLVDDTLMAHEYKAALGSFDAFCTVCGAPPSEALRDVYDTAPTLLSFFASLRERHLDDAETPFCALVGPWVEPLIRTMLRDLHRNAEWVIKADRFSSQQHGECCSEVSGGGGGEDTSWCCGAVLEGALCRGRGCCFRAMVLPSEEA